MGEPLDAPWLRQAIARGLIPPEQLAGPDGTAADLGGLVLAVSVAGFPEPVPEHEFARPARGWRFDLAWPALLVAFEREGGDWRTVKCEGCGRPRRVFVSRHHSRDGLEADAEKYNAAAALGWAVVRATPPMIADGRAARDLIRALEARTR